MLLVRLNIKYRVIYFNMTIKKSFYLIGDRIMLHLTTSSKGSTSKFFVAKSRIVSVTDSYKCILDNGEEQSFTYADMRNFEDLNMLKIVEYPREIVASPLWYCASLYEGTIIAMVIFENFWPGDVVYYFELTREFFIKRGAKLIHTISVQYRRDQSIAGSFVFMGESELVRFSELSRKETLLPDELQELKNIKTIVYKDGRYKSSIAMLC